MSKTVYYFEITSKTRAEYYRMTLNQSYPLEEKSSALSVGVKLWMTVSNRVWVSDGNNIQLIKGDINDDLDFASKLTWIQLQAKDLW